MKYILIATIIIFAGCDRSSNTNQDNLKTIKIDFARARIKIPSSYELTSINEFRNLLTNSNKSRNVIESSLLKLNKMESIPFSIILYVDSTDFENTIWFQEGEHVQLTKSIAGQYLGLLSKTLQNEWTRQGIKYTKIESKYSDGGNANVIKLKYKLDDGISIRYSSQYIISTGKRTWAINVNNIKKDDLDKLISGIRIY